MKSVFTILFCSILLIPLSAQKVDYKKGMISIDKEKKYIIEKTEKGGLFGRGEFALQNMEGNNILGLVNTSLYYEQLPNEEGEREAYAAYAVIVPGVDKREIIPYPSTFSVSKYLFEQLEAIGFFETQKMDAEMYDKFVSSQNVKEVEANYLLIDSINIQRKKNYDLTKDEFGPLKKRKPNTVRMEGSSIKDGLVIIGNYKLDKKGSYAHVYQIINADGYVIGGFTDIPSEGRANVRTLVDEKRQWFPFKNLPNYQYTLTDKFAVVARYLVTHGYL